MNQLDHASGPLWVNHERAEATLASSAITGSSRHDAGVSRRIPSTSPAIDNTQSNTFLPIESAS